MFKHIFITRLKCLLRERSLVFWTLIFPIVLGTFFYLAFSNIDNATDFEVIDLAVINNAAYQNNIGFKDLITSLSNKDDNQIFNTKYTTIDEAKKLLEDNKISGYVEITDKISLYVNNNGFNATIIKSVVDNYLQVSSSINNIVSLNPEAIKQGVLKEASKQQDYTSDKTNNNMKGSVLYFYSLIGMVCMYAGFWGVKVINESQANLSPLGARTSITPVNRGKVLVYSLLASFMVQIIESFIILVYLIGVLKVDFGNQLGYIMLITGIGSITGITFGAMISASSTKSENMKTALLILCSMALSFMAGLMVLDIRYIINSNIPILGYINPANLITDALYSLYYYPTYNRFFFDVILLSALTIIFSSITYIFIRRRRYESI